MWLPFLSLMALSAFLLYYFRRIAAYGWAYLRMQLSLRRFLFLDRTAADTFAERLRATPNAPAIAFEGRTWSYAALDRRSSRVACWALEAGLRPRHVVALMMENRPDFIALWLGMAKIGVTTALINTNLRGASLSHCLRACEARMMIVGAECMEALQGVRAELPPSMPIWVHTEGAEDAASAPATPSPHHTQRHASLAAAAAGEGTLAGSSSPPLDLAPVLASYPDLLTNFAPHRKAAGVGSSDLLFLIFTSGTTGLPKAARIKHLRFHMTAAGFVHFFGIRAQDRIFCCLPLYHSAGGMIGISCCWATGATLVLRRKFSARSFFAECARERVSIIQYIGQLARYLLATPPSAHDRGHRIRLALGNGLQEEVWDPFCKRFNIPRVAEFYASTEGNANLVNLWNRKGVIGWIPPLAKLLYPLRIVRFDPVEERPFRDAKTGFCVECEPGETGELIAKIDASGKDPIRQFDGYTNPSATSSKILSNVFRPGDRWFRSGDLVRSDAEGFISFSDRVGDTFRWKGENVATTEVEGAVMMEGWLAADGGGGGGGGGRGRVRVKEANVYGVLVPGNEGRAGMASIVLDGGDDGAHAPLHSNGDSNGHSSSSVGVEADGDFLRSLYGHLHAQLPQYMMPLFLRISPAMDVTSTFKHRKGDLVSEGFNPSVIRDPLFFRDEQQKRFVPLDAELYSRIQAGQVRL